MNPVDVLNQIKRLTTDVIAVGICDKAEFSFDKIVYREYQRDWSQFLGQFYFSEECSLS